MFHTDLTIDDSLTLEFALFRADRRLNFNWSAKDGELFLRFVTGTVQFQISKKYLYKHDFFKYLPSSLKDGFSKSFSLNVSSTII